MENIKNICLLRNINLTTVLIAQTFSYSTTYMAFDIVKNEVKNKIVTNHTSLTIVLRPTSQVVLAEWLRPNKVSLSLWDINHGIDQNFDYPIVDLYCILVVADRMLVFEKNCKVHIFNFVTRRHEENLKVPKLCTFYYPMGEDGFIGIDNTTRTCHWHSIGASTMNLLEMPEYPSLWSSWNVDSALLSFAKPDSQWRIAKLYLKKIDGQVEFRWANVNYSFDKSCKFLLSLEDDYMLILDGTQVYWFHYDTGVLLKIFKTENEIQFATLCGNRLVYKCDKEIAVCNLDDQDIKF